LSAEIEAAEAEKAAIAAAQEAVLTTTATGDIITEAEEIAAKAEREYEEALVPATVGAPEPVTETEDATESAQPDGTSPEPAVAAPFAPVLPGLEDLPLSLLTPSNATVAELIASLALRPDQVESEQPQAEAEPRGPDAGAAGPLGQAVIPGLELLPDALLAPSSDRVELARTAFAASYMGLGTSALSLLRKRMPAARQDAPAFESLPDALLTPSIGDSRG